MNLNLCLRHTGDDSTETEDSEKTISKKRSEPSSDKPNPKYMKITLPLSKSDENRFSNMSRLSQEDYKIPMKKKPKKIPEPLVAVPEVIQDPDDMEKVIKLAVALKDLKNIPVCVTPHP